MQIATTPRTGAEAAPVAAGRPPAARSTPYDILIAAASMGLVTGFAEVLILAFRKLVLGEIISLSQHFVWMAPLGYVLLYLPLAAVLALGAARFRRVGLDGAAGVFAFLSALGVLWMFPRLHKVAMLVLAAGVGVQVARMAAGRTAALARVARRALVPLAAAAALSGLAISGALWTAERRASAALPAVAAGAPNVLLLILDTVRAASLGLYGYDRPTTPNLERLAARGVVFDRALATSPWTLPSHATLFTGRHPHELEANWKTPLEDRDPTLAEVLAGRGWITAGFVANPFYGTWEFGLDRGFVHWEDYTVSLGQTLNSASLGSFLLAGRPGFNHNFFRRVLHNYEYLGRKKADDVSADFLDWLGDGRDRPYFAFLNFMDAHVPYTPPADLAERFGVRAPPPLWHRLTGNRSTLTEEQRRAGDYDRDRYDASIASLDRELGALFEELERRGELANTVVIITSDHGEHLGEKDIYGHANSLYMQNLHVPLLIWGPTRVPAGGARIERLVSLQSLPATILDLVGVDEPRIPGASLAGLWSGGAAPTETVAASVRKGINMEADLPVARGDLYSVATDSAHYIRNPDGGEELYDLTADMMDATPIEAREGDGPRSELRRRLDLLLGRPAAQPADVVRR